MTQKKNKLKSPLFRIVCYLLMLNVLFMGITFARYVSTTNPDPTVDVSPFACSIKIDKTEGSSFIFNNANYTHEGYVMNTPQITSFTVRNYEGNKVADVDISYSIVFYVPVLFAQSATVQITKNNSEAVTPLYVLSDFLNYKSFTTTSGYGEIGSLDQTFNYTNGMFVADNGSVVVEEVSFESEIVRSFPCFSGDNMLSHLYLTTTETVDYYKFIISHNSFNIMKGKTPSDSNYQLRVVPSKGMSESSAVIDDDFDKDWDNFKDKADENNISSMSDWTVSMSAGKISMQYGNTVYSDVKVEKCDGKTYPCRLNAIFEQVSTAS